MKKAREYRSSTIDEILSETSKTEERKISNRMRLASKIIDAMNARGWNNNELMKRMGKNSPSLISRWLSGTHNFTTDTLSELEEVFQMNFLDLEKKEETTIHTFHLQVSQKSSNSHQRDDNETISNATDMSILSNGFRQHFKNLA